MNAVVIINTFNKSSYLDLTLFSLSRQTYPDFSIIICDDGSTDNTSNVVMKWSNDLNIQYIKTDNNGAAFARNKGISQIESEDSLLIFLDDDRLLLPSGIEDHIKYHKEAPFPTFLAGIRWEMFRGLDEKSQSLIYEEIANNRLIKYRRHVETLSRIISPYLNTQENLWPLRWYGVLTGNLSVPYSLVNTLEGFDNSFFRLEDIELGYRAQKAGMKVSYSETIESFHMAHKRVLNTENFKNALESFKKKHVELEVMYINDFLTGNLCSTHYLELIKNDSYNEAGDCCESCKTNKVKYFTNYK